jgi:penicillin-binding protein 1C
MMTLLLQPKNRQRAHPGWLPLLALCCCTLAQAGAPEFAEVKKDFVSSYAVLLDRDGEVLQVQRMDLRNDRLPWVGLDQISPALTDAVVFAEDRGFYRNGGVDWLATAKATLKFLRGDKSRGASTITMQVAAQLDPDLGWRRGGRTLSQKWRQMDQARELNARWSKAQVLEAYLNLTQFRGDLQGVATASGALFGRSPAALTRAQSLVLAALLPAPSAPALKVAERACALIAAGYTGVSCEQARDLALSTLNRRQPPLMDDPALAGVATQLLTTPGQQQTTSINGPLQHFAEESLRAQLAGLRARSVSAGAVLVLDNATGEVLAYVGNAGLVEKSRYVDGIRALRQAGSTLKPFLYELALEKQYLTAASIVQDAPLNLATPDGLYTPQDYEKDFKGPVSARVALAGSLNTPAVRVLGVVGVDPFWQRLHELGFASLTESPDFYGYALALGAADVNLWSLTSAYRGLATQGLVGEPHFAPGTVGDTQRVMAAAPSFVVADMISDRSARAITFGLDNPLSLPFWTAVKTGTSKDMRDNWCVGFSGRYTVGVWVGNLNGAPMEDVSGITGAAPVWAELMRFLEGGRLRPGQPGPLAPPGLVQQRVHFAGIGEPDRDEWFMPGTAMSTVTYLADSSVRILYPVDETLVALDPDIPAANQHMRFHAETRGQALEWWLDDHRLGAARDLDWAPVPGRHHLSLRDAAGKAWDAVDFTVRGRYHNAARGGVGAGG